MKNLIMILIGFGTLPAFAAEDTLANAIAAALQDGVDAQSSNVVAKLAEQDVKSAMTRDHIVTVIKVENAIASSDSLGETNVTQAPQTEAEMLEQEEVIEDEDLVKQLKELRD